MSYYLDLFTGGTWDEFLKSGAGVTGFREKQWSRAARIRPDDVFLCYMKGISRWVGALRATSKRFRDETPIWKTEVFPVRFQVEPIITLKPEYGIPVHDLLGSLSWDPKTWTGHVRGSPARIAKADGDVILAALKEAEAKPRAKPFDPKKLRRVPAYSVKAKRGKRSAETFVTVPDKDEDGKPSAGDPDHSRIQRMLLSLGSRMGMSLWVAANDRGRVLKEGSPKPLRLLKDLPTQFDAATTRTIEMIDVLWLKGNSIVAAFEIEHTTSIYSGLLRMSDLLAMQPNLDIRLYLVAPDDRREKALKEIARPTFSVLKKPLHSVCRFLPYSQLQESMQKYEAVAHHLKAEFLDDISEDCSPEE